MNKRKVIIIGGGVAGLSVAYHLANNSQDNITILEANLVGQGTTSKAAGMITPAPEIQLGEDEFLKCILKCSDYYSEFIESLTQGKPERVDFHRTGTLMCAIDSDGQRDLERLVEFQRSMGLDVEALSQDNFAQKEPHLSHKVKSAYHIKNEAYVDNLLLPKILKEELLKRGVTIREHVSVTDIDIENDSITSVTLNDGTSLTADVFVLASGLKHGIPKLDEAQPLKLRPVKGQALAVQCAPGTISHSIRFFHRYSTYLVPRQNGEVVIGATSEELGDENLTPGGIMDLLYAAWQILPQTWDKPITRLWAGLRPTTPDHKPIVGTSRLKNLFLLLGLYRHGIKMAPFLGREVARLICEKETELQWSEFSAERFA